MFPFTDVEMGRKTNKASISDKCDVYLTKWIFMRFSLAPGEPPIRDIGFTMYKYTIYNMH